MFKKIFYSLTILAMLFGMFGVMGKGGVQPAKAALTAGFYDVLGTAQGAPINAAIGFADNDIALVGAAGPDAGDLGMCGTIPIGTYQAWAYHGTTLPVGGLTAHVHVITTDPDIVVGIFQFTSTDVLEANLGCETNDATGTDIDLVATVPAGKRFGVLLAGAGGVVPADAALNVWITLGTDTSGGVIVAGLSNPAGGAPIVTDAYQLYDETLGVHRLHTTAGFGATFNDVDGGAGPRRQSFFFNRNAADTFNLGLARGRTATGGFRYALYAGDIGNFYYNRNAVTGAIQDWIDAATARFNLRGQSLAADGLLAAATLPAASLIVVQPSNGLGEDFLDLGLATVNYESIMVTPGTWDLGWMLDQAGGAGGLDYNTADYFLAAPGQAIALTDVRNVSLRAFTGGNALVRVGESWASNGLTAAWLNLTAGSLSPWFDTDNGDEFVAANNYSAAEAAEVIGENYILSPAVDYVAMMDLTGGANDYYLGSVDPVWNFAATNYVVVPPVLPTLAYEAIFGMWLDDGAGVAANASNWVKDANEDTFRIADFSWSGSEVVRGAWVDGLDNPLWGANYADNSRLDCLTGLAIVDAGVAQDVVSPCYVFTRGVLRPRTELANDYEVTNLTPDISGIGRYMVTASLQAAVAGMTTRTSRLYATTYPTDASTDHWAWAWIQAAYERGITTGTSAGVYSPDSPVTRAQMAVFLLRAEHGSTYAPPAVGTSTGFSDVAIDYWAAAWIKQLAAEQITVGCGTGVYCPEDLVTRDQMAQFLEKMARRIVNNGGLAFFTQDGLGGNNSAFNAPLGSDILGLGNTAGYDGLFMDVPITNFAAIWIEELAADGITNGCAGALANGTWMYCPTQPVTRGEMAAFLARAFYEANPGFPGLIFPSPIR